ncbi:hypothetical protein IMSAGC018_02034 [Lachnospiraceae bacterium]|nr:hypothetical protein IMSAGC018_02034 [Lachnospiraceae bacterium]
MSSHKKKKNGLLYLLVLLLFILCSFVILGIRQYQESLETKIIAAKLEPWQLTVSFSGKDTSEASLSYMQCQKDGYVEDSYVDAVNQQLSAIPPYIQDAFVRDGWSIYVTNMNIAQTYYPGQFDMVMATTNYEERRILIEDRADAVYESPIHEVGHWFDLYLGFVSNSNLFAQIYNEESAAFIQAYGTDCVRDEMEFFAEGFWYYIVNPDRLMSVSPQLYQFLHSMYCHFRIYRTWYEYSSIFA